MSEISKVSPIILLLVICGCLGFGGCSGDSSKPTDNVYLRNRSDTSYSGQRDPTGERCRSDANGSKVCMSDYDGNYVWVEYGAPWCSTCKRQAKVSAKAVSSTDPDIAFVAVITSSQGGYGTTATLAEASSWASLHGISKEDVLIADNLSAQTVPFHIFYSPQGHTLARLDSSLTSTQIADSIKEGKRLYESWQ